MITDYVLFKLPPSICRADVLRGMREVAVVDNVLGRLVEEQARA
jgi:hypothetical protein